MTDTKIYKSGFRIFSS